MKRFLCALVFIGLPFAIIGLIGCASLTPGADPLVVRVEQTETTASQVFQSVLSVDNADRGFWRTNAPGFHNFCEWLRQPQGVLITNTVPVTVPRDIAIVMNLDNVKLQYKSSLASSNVLWTALDTMLAVVQQGVSWLGVVTNSTPPTP